MKRFLGTAAALLLLLSSCKMTGPEFSARASAVVAGQLELAAADPLVGDEETRQALADAAEVLRAVSAGLAAGEDAETIQDRVDAFLVLADRLRLLLDDEEDQATLGHVVRAVQLVNDLSRPLPTDGGE